MISFSSWIGGELKLEILFIWNLIPKTSFREIPSFGRDTIRRFTANCSEMKKMVAHDFENMLQVSTAIFSMIMDE